MNINHTFQYLQMGLPERINRKKLFGDFEGALQDMESYLLTPDLPDAMRHCLTAEAEMLRRLPSDFPYTREEALAVARKEVPDFSEEEFDQLERKFRIRWIYQNGEKRYFDRFFENLCRTDPEMAGRAGKETAPRNGRYFQKAIEAMHRDGKAVKRFYCRSSVKLKDEVFRKGAVVRAYLPIPCACDSQTEIRIEKVTPVPAYISPENAPQRVVFWEETMEKNHPFEVEFSYIRTAVYKELFANPEKTSVFVPESEKQWLREQAPHILFTPYIRELVRTLGDGAETPLEKAKRFYDFVTMKVRYSFMPAYFSQESIAENCARNLIGDCGVQTLLFITLCRCAGIPAKWESGWAAEPGFCGAHDWARFYVEPYGWLYADVSYGGDAAQRGDEKRRVHYFGNLDPYRMMANTEFQADFDVSKDGWRADPYDNQEGEMELDGRGLLYSEFIRKKEVLECSDL